ncbi:MAG: hypothetical protein ACI9FN_001917 [Saprospiraceae bacterium]|jgi:hypothetical protein
MSHIYNQADYGNGAIVDIKAFSYNLYQQHTITLPGGFKRRFQDSFLDQEFREEYLNTIPVGV